MKYILLMLLIIAVSCSDDEIDRDLLTTYIPVEVKKGPTDYFTVVNGELVRITTFSTQFEQFKEDICDELNIEYFNFPFESITPIFFDQVEVRFAASNNSSAFDTLLHAGDFPIAPFVNSLEIFLDENQTNTIKLTRDLNGDQMSYCYQTLLYSQNENGTIVYSPYLKEECLISTLIEEIVEDIPSTYDLMNSDTIAINRSEIILRPE